MKVIPVKGLPFIKPGDDLGGLLLRAMEVQGIDLEDGDVLVVVQSVVSKAEGNIVDLKEVEPSDQAKRIAKRIGKTPSEVEVILQETEEIIRLAHVIISRTKHGFICANAGVDSSNAGPGRVTLLPENPDVSARSIREKIRRNRRVKIGVIISDSQGRPFRLGAVGVAIGVAGIKPLIDLRGKVDNYGRKLKSTIVAAADSLAASAALVMGESDEGTPAAVIRGAPILQGEGSAKDVFRCSEEDLFT